MAELESLVAEHPLREPFPAQLMLALYRAGRQAEALDSYRAARAFLLDELGIEPDAMSYEILGEIEGVGEKARRDAGGLAVADVRRP